MESDDLKQKIMLAMMDAQDNICGADAPAPLRRLVGAAWIEGTVWGIEHAANLIGPKAADLVVEILRQREGKGDVPDSSGR